MDDKPPMDAAARKPRKNKKEMPQKSDPPPPFHDFISAKLKSFYAEIASEPIPDRFTELLKELDAKSRSDERKKS